MAKNRRRRRRRHRRQNLGNSEDASTTLVSDNEGASTALVKYSPSEEASHWTFLKRKITDLQQQLDRMKDKAKALCHNYERKCSKFLKTAIRGLLTLSNTVDKADKLLVFWYENGKILNLMLRLLGIDRETSAVVARKTTKLKTQVATVERQFESTNLISKKALVEVQAFNRHVNEYSQSGIGGVQDEVKGVFNRFDEKIRQIGNEIKEKKIKCDRVNADILETKGGISRANSDQDRASEARGSATTVSQYHCPCSWGSAFIYNCQTGFCCWLRGGNCTRNHLCLLSSCRHCSRRGCRGGCYCWNRKHHRCRVR